MFEQLEDILTASWNPRDGLVVTFADLPDAWLVALDRLVRDVPVRQYGDSIEHIDLAVKCDPDGGIGWLYSAVSVAGKREHGLSVSGSGAHLDDDAEKVLVSMADLLQNEIADTGTAWPWGRTGGFMTVALIDGVACWKGRGGETVRVGDLGSTQRKASQS